MSEGQNPLVQLLESLGLLPVDPRDELDRMMVNYASNAFMTMAHVMAAANLQQWISDQTRDMEPTPIEREDLIAKGQAMADDHMSKARLFMSTAINDAVYASVNPENKMTHKLTAVSRFVETLGHEIVRQAQAFKRYEPPKSVDPNNPAHN